MEKVKFYGFNYLPGWRSVITRRYWIELCQSKWKLALESSCILITCVLLWIVNYLNVTAFILVQVLLLFELRVLHVFLASRASAHPVRFVFLNRSWNGRNYGKAYLMALLVRILECFCLDKVVFLGSGCILNLWCKIRYLYMEATSLSSFVLSYLLFW